ncbi:helix-turn-helix domain-containing protein [Parachitinimonas caeni]|uniref:Helix-turn-helix domain-containing protein n=1 Tax=Parachitinimonas caeni TaxID=3031301 RepID=A0ABT7E6P4_9NEIS|nr:helix-turn-helix domain-containing protein [Parachitinimonas caeni]MDK2126582.1 helix-turn-helix domain-containing protein [Parachitinimonas caeni]
MSRSVTSPLIQTKTTSGPVDARVEQAVLEITRQFRGDLSLHDLAAAVSLSPHHFHRLFLAEMGETPMAYLRRVRVSHADHLLAALPDASLLSIALDSGFSSPACFSRAYRQIYGQSPSAIRAGLKHSGPATDPQGPQRPQLCHLPTRHLRVVRQVLDDALISKTLVEMAGNQATSGPSILGIFVDAPFHVPPPQCRYFLARDIDAERASDHDVLTLPGGYYARMTFTGATEHLGPAVFAFHDEVLVPSAYALASTLFFERLRPQQSGVWDYPTCKRELFLKVRRKGEPVI